MLNRLLDLNKLEFSHAFGVLLIAVGLPLSKVLMSIGTIWLFVHLFVAADFKNYWNNLKKNVVFWFILILFSFHIIGLFYTSDFSYAFHDIKAKLPLFIIPVALIAYPLKNNYFIYILYGFLLSLLLTSLLNFYFILATNETDYREFSRFGSHIRYAILIVMGILLLLYLFLQKKEYRWIYIPLLCWFLYYTFISGVGNGYISLLALLFSLFLYKINQIINTKLKRGIIVSIIGVFCIFFICIYQHYTTLPPITDKEHFPKKSRDGELYNNNFSSEWVANKHYVLIGVANKEIDESWSEVSSLNLEMKLENGYSLRNALYSYMTSKGLTKDREGMEKMTKKDIQNVESGIFSIVQTYSPVKKNIIQLENAILYHKMGLDPNGNSILQRFEHWRIACQIIKNNWLIGVGTGDVQIAFNNQYESSETLLAPSRWYRAHNQFLTFWISFGIVGFLVFIGFWIYFLIRNIQLNSLVGIGFTCIAIASFLSEDTIETQQGVTFVAFFLGLIATHMFTQAEKK